MTNPIFKLNVWTFENAQTINRFDYKCAVCRKDKSKELIFKLYDQTDNPEYFIFDVVCSEICYNVWLLAYSGKYLDSYNWSIRTVRSG